MDETGRLVENDSTFLITNDSGALLADDGSRNVAIVFAPAKNGRAAPAEATPKRERRCTTCGK